MLSKIELEFLKAPETFEPDYRRILRFRIKSKVQKIKSEIALLEAHGVNVTENCNGVTEFCTHQRREPIPHWAAFLNQGGASGGIWSRDHYLTKVTPHRARLPRRKGILPEQNV